MGTPVPITLPEIDPAKWYHCVVVRFNDWPLEIGCDGTPDPILQHGCIIGANIVDPLFWQECVTNKPLIPIFIGDANRLVAIHGPYGSLVECAAAHPPGGPP